MIIVVGGIKGGGGKTTIATNLAVWFVLQGKKTLLIDADEQKSATSWAEQRDSTFQEKDSMDERKALPTISLSGRMLHEQLRRMKGDYDYVIVDTGGRDTTSQRSALTVADKFLVPFKPRSLDVWTVTDVKRLIGEIQAVNPSLQSYYIINQGDSRGTDNSDATDIIRDMDCMESIPSVIGYRKAFSNAAAQGLSVWEIDRPDEKACTEMQHCAEYLYRNDIKNMKK
jgi:chromosome partitioning protein